jgi:NADH-quinone oxidoreductase subunit I
MTSADAHTTHAAAPSGPTVLSVSDKNPRVRTIQVVRPEPEDASFLVATGKGLGVTLKHFFKNFFLPRKKADILGKSGGAPADARFRNDIETVQYPEEKVEYPERFRGLHRLMVRDDGQVRCVACMLCPTVCPAHCISIVPEESDAATIEKRPAIFEIDELRCVVCGLCVEACPCDAIRMDTGIHAPPVEERADAIEDKQSRMARGVKSTAAQGGLGPNWREQAPEHQKK